MIGPLRVEFGNFTPPQRTPWGGCRIIQKYKAGLASGLPPDSIVGESWEVSTEPSFPSRLEDGELLSDAISDDPTAWLGHTIAERYDSQNPLLVKLIDPATTLSVQVHPPENYPLLGPGESGKTEGWLVLDTQPGAAVYLGFGSGVTLLDVERTLANGSSLEPLLNRVGVQVGDVFVIRPGLVHALGAGVTVVEPQRVRPRRTAVTYRLWDWNRAFDESGRVSINGRRRQLHVREALAVTNWTSTERTALRVLPQIRNAHQTILLNEPELFVEEYFGTVSAPLPLTDRMRALLCLSGHAHITSPNGDLHLHAGETCVVPAIARHVRLVLHDGRVLLASVQN
jgi:mannose-6-phosphate isomerase